MQRFGTKQSGPLRQPRACTSHAIEARQPAFGQRFDAGRLHAARPSIAIAAILGAGARRFPDLGGDIQPAALSVPAESRAANPRVGIANLHRVELRRGSAGVPIRRVQTYAGVFARRHLVWFLATPFALLLLDSLSVPIARRLSAERRSRSATSSSAPTRSVSSSRAASLNVKPVASFSAFSITGAPAG